jgi:hypothetical protein
MVRESAWADAPLMARVAATATKHNFDEDICSPK